MIDEIINWTLNDDNIYGILSIISILVGFITLIFWFFTKSEDHENYRDFGLACIFGAPLMGPFMVLIVLLFVTITPFYLIVKELTNLKEKLFKPNVRHF